MDTTTILISVLSSSAVSGVIVFAVQTYMKGKINHHFQQEIEKLKSELSIEQNQKKIISDRRNEAYPIIVELVYKTRNMARDIVTIMDFKSKSLIEEFSSKTRDLEEVLYKYRIDLERDNCFTEIHGYKNALLNLNMKISDILFFFENNAEDKAMKHKTEMQNDYNTIEKSHQELISILSNKK